MHMCGVGRSNNDLSPPRQANRGRETVPGLILNSMSNYNLLKREAVYSCSQSRKVKISFRRKYEVVGGAGAERVLGAEEMETNVQMECVELGSKEKQIEYADNLRIPFKETTLTIFTNTKGEHMAMEVDIIDLIQNENASSNSSTLLNIIGNEIESTILTNPSLCKNKTKSEVTAGQGEIKCELREERIEWSQDVTHIS